MSDATDYQALRKEVEKNIRELVVPAVSKFIEIPNLSRDFDPEWETNGLMDQACNLNIEFANTIGIKGLEVKLYKEPGITPLVFGTVPATREGSDKTHLMYGHIDKQPHLTEHWREGLHPFKPVIENGLLYGRGGVDDGYNFFTVLAIIKTYQTLGIKHDRFVLFYETDEESASKDIPHWLKKFEDVIGKPQTLFVLDSASVSKNIFSISTTLRGCVNFDLKVRVLEKGMHSGMGSGIVPSTFRIIRHLLDRIECPKSGKIIDDLQVEIPEDKQCQATHAAKVIGDGFVQQLCFCKGVKPVSDNVEELYLNNIWRSQLEIIGQSGIPTIPEGGNVMREETVLRCSMRLPPTLAGDKAFEICKEILEKDPPYNAHVSVELVSEGSGWSSNEVPNKVMAILEKHNQEIFGTKTLMFGCGGSIPFVKVLQDMLPETLLFVSGIVLPDSGMHAPNECMDIEYLVKFSQSLSCFLTDYSTI